MKHYPVNLNLLNKKVVIIGGGKVAERKLFKLLETEADITVVSPKVTERIVHVVEEGRVKWKQTTFSKEDVKAAFLVIAATNSKQVNDDVYESCRDQQLVSLVDDPSRSNFIVPSTLHRGKLVISVSTSAASPGLSKKITEKLSAQFDDAYEEYVEFLSQCRLKVLDEIDEAEQRRRIFQKLLEPEFLELTREKSYLKRDELFLALLKKERN